VVISPPTLEVRPVDAASFSDILPLLLLFKNGKMSAADWQYMLFTYPWWDGPIRGYALYADDVAVGFMGTIFSELHVNGRLQRFCNLSSWIVRDDFRHASMLLLKPILALRDCTLLNLTPTPRTADIFRKLGFKELETDQTIVPAIDDPRRFFRTPLTPRDTRFEERLRPDDRTIFNQAKNVPNMQHVIVGGNGDSCYVVAAPLQFKRLPFAQILYYSDAESFWQNRGALHAALARAIGAVGFAIDKRFRAEDSKSIAFHRKTQRLYRPASPDIRPRDIHGIFTELMTVKI
jgi:hypothetical protein